LASTVDCHVDQFEPVLLADHGVGACVEGTRDQVGVRRHGQNDDCRFRMVLDDVLDQVDAITMHATRHVEIHDDDVAFLLLEGFDQPG
jgi:hypothetical protein